MQAPVQPLSCIAVIPAVTSVDKDDTISYDEARNYAIDIEELDRLMRG